MNTRLKTAFLKTLFPKRTSFVLNKFFHDLITPIKSIEIYTKLYKENIQNDKSN